MTLLFFCVYLLSQRKPVESIGRGFGAAFGHDYLLRLPIPGKPYFCGAVRTAGSGPAAPPPSDISSRLFPAVFWAVLDRRQ